MNRRNPSPVRPHRTRGPVPPPPPPTPAELRASRRAAERAEAEVRAAAKAAARAEARRLAAVEAEKTAEFRRRRGCPPSVVDEYVEILRRQGAWWNDR